ncbi:MAG TPA: glycine betaine ABC transporter substrate-binding protein [Solirubrobacteraceae bacterium]|nr:glycine betaine ABC transporter substrate-binding protein [Solirubrobacteraceae bacterium]
MRNIAAALAALMVAAGLAACGSSSSSSSTSKSETPGNTKSAQTITANPANKKVTVTIGSKNFTEEYILGNIYAQALKAAGYNVKTQLNLGSEQIALKALKAGQIDAYPEYTGTALTSFFGVKTTSIPTDAQAAYNQAKGDFAKQGLAALPPTPFTDSNAVAVTPATAKQLGTTTISGLKPKASTLTIAGTPECRQRQDCLLGLQKTYGLKFKSFTPVDPSLLHEVLQKGQADLSVVFTTDGQIKANKEVLLNDDKNIFPPYNITLVVSQKALNNAGPDFAKTVALVQKGMTTPVMQELNSRVDLDKQKPAAVATEYLKESGYIK